MAPVLSREASIALTLRTVGGLTTEEIARAFMLPVATVQQRIVRAKKTLAAAAIPFEAPPPDEFGPRLAAVLGVLYLIFNEGHAASSGSELMRPDLSREALRLARVVAALVPNESEAHRSGEACVEFRRAAEWTHNDRERHVFLAKAAAIGERL